MSTLFQSSIPADILKSSNDEQAKQALIATGMNVTVNQVSDLKDFGNKIFVAGTPVLPKGAEFMLKSPVHVTGTDRSGNPVSYDAFTVVLSTGEERIISITNLLSAWVAEEADMTSEQLKSFENHPKSLEAIAEFYRVNNKASVINSPAAGFTMTSALAERIQKLASGVLTVDDAVSFEFDWVKRATGESGTGRQRMFAFSAKTTAKAITDFGKQVKSATK